MLLNEVKGIDVIKFAAEAYMGMGGSPTKLLVESAEWLFDCYVNNGDPLCLDAAVQITYAYVELGLIYDDAKEIFDKIMLHAGQESVNTYPQGIYASTKLKLKKSKICEVLGRWPRASQKQYSAEWVALDII